MGAADDLLLSDVERPLPPLEGEDAFHVTRAGVLVEPGQAKALAAALECVLSDPDLARRLGAGARQVAEREVALTSVAAKYERLYRELIVAGAREIAKGAGE